MTITKTTLVSYALFAVLVAGLLFGVKYLNKSAAIMRSDAKNIEADILNNSWDKAYSSTESMLLEWESISHNLTIIIDHQKLDIVSVEMLKLSQYAKGKNLDECLASVKAIMFYLDHLMTLERTIMQNIL